MEGAGDQAPPPGFMDGPVYYDDAREISRLEAELKCVLEQILSLNANGMMRIQIVLARIQRAPPKVVVDRGMH